MRTWAGPGCGTGRSTSLKSAPGCGTSTALIIFGMAHLHERTEPFDVAVLERVLHLIKGEVEVPTSCTPSPAALPRCACGYPRPGAAVPHRSASRTAPARSATARAIASG